MKGTVRLMTQTDSQSLEFPLKSKGVVISNRYEVLSIINDILIGIWFLVGSCLFFSSSLMFAGTVLFVIGSLAMLARSFIRLTRRIHLQNYRSGTSIAPANSQDF